METQKKTTISTGFAPIVGKNPTHLILGTMPGRQSLDEARYYAHPRNAFWPILRAWLGLPADADYAAGCAALRHSPLVLWDVLASCVRPGSLDSAIQRESMTVNAFQALFETHRRLTTVLCNGATARRLFDRHVVRGGGDWLPDLEIVTLPSTSPAYASMALADKRKHWLAALPGSAS